MVVIVTVCLRKWRWWVWFSGTLQAGLWIKPIGLIQNPDVGSHLVLCCIHRMNRVNSRNALSMMTAPQRLSWH